MWGAVDRLCRLLSAGQSDGMGLEPTADQFMAERLIFVPPKEHLILQAERIGSGAQVTPGAEVTVRVRACVAVWPMRRFAVPSGRPE